VISAIVVLSVLWRRATFRYIRDPRRQRQFMLLRRLVVSCAVVVVAVFSFVTEFGSLATFAGILTAGIAVSLQTLILSGVAYFFFVGRYGVRVGDRVTVAGVTGEVLDTGLFRLYLMELGGARRLDPTGRVVVFANSVLFQPSGFYKQVPGADYVWHEMCLTLSPDSDHRLAETRLLGAAEAVFAEHREAIDRQHAAARHANAGAVPANPPRPAGRLRFVDAGLEFTLRYPVEVTRASEVEDRLTRQFLAAIEQEPRLRVVASGTPVIQAAIAP
jgi:small-conductance mechanosensitive channel